MLTEYLDRETQSLEEGNQAICTKTLKANIGKRRKGPWHGGQSKRRHSSR